MVHYKDSIFGLKNAWLDNVMSMFIPLFNILWLNPLYDERAQTVASSLAV